MCSSLLYDFLRGWRVVELRTTRPAPPLGDPNEAKALQTAQTLRSSLPAADVTSPSLFPSKFIAHQRSSSTFLQLLKGTLHPTWWSILDGEGSPFELITRDARQLVATSKCLAGKNQSHHGFSIVHRFRVTSQLTNFEDLRDVSTLASVDFTSPPASFQRLMVMVA